MPEIENYDYKILKFVCDLDEPVRMGDITAKFDRVGRTAAVQLCRDKLLYWECLDGDLLSHDDTCTVKVTDKGRLAYQRYSYNKQLETGERWKERIVSYFLGVLTPITVYIITEYLLPLIGG